MTDKILIVDDETYILEILQEVLSKEGFPCDTAIDAFQAMSLLEREPFALLLTDFFIKKRRKPSTFKVGG